MKKILTLVFALFLGMNLINAQEETLIDDLRFTGGFGAPILEFSEINGQLTADIGGGGALVLNNFFLGGYGMGTSFPEYDLDGESYDIRFKHGGLWMGYVQKPYKLFHFYSSLKVGWGKTKLLQDKDAQYTDNIMSIIPEIGIELNVTKFMHIGFTGGYRLVSGVSKLEGLTNEDFSSPVGVITFRFGGFSGMDDW